MTLESTIAEQSGVLKKLLSAEIEKQKKVERKLTNAAKKHCERTRNETKTRLSHRLETYVQCTLYTLYCYV